MRFLFKFLLIVISLLLSASAIIYWWMHSPIFNKITLNSSQTIELVVPTGSSAIEVGRKLHDLGASTGPELFSLASRIAGVHKSLKAGVYSLSSTTSLASILARISAGDSLHASITLIEGWTFEQVITEIHKHPHIKKSLSSSDITLLSETLASTFGVLTKSMEGWIYPDTYFFQYGASDQQLIKRAVWLQKESLNYAWNQRSEFSKLNSPIEALNLASIIEKETQYAPDRKMVSGVFHNRLAMNMRLQSDPTIIYGLGSEFDGNLQRKHLKTDSTYNSYLRFGLPPTPISNPGRLALLAAVNPAKTKALYFVAKGDGTSFFSQNFQQHKRAVNYYQKGIGSPPRQK